MKKYEQIVENIDDVKIIGKKRITVSNIINFKILIFFKT